MDIVLGSHAEKEFKTLNLSRDVTRVVKAE